MSIKIALIGNPNSGKTTLFNALTGSNQYVGNWPGVTVEKKTGRLPGHGDAEIVDLPGIYSLTPYSPEETVSRNFLTGAGGDARPDVVLNIVDGTNLERNLLLTTQILELGIPVVLAVNMMDAVDKKGAKIDVEKLAGELGCKAIGISALKNQGVKEAAALAVETAKSGLDSAGRAAAARKLADDAARYAFIGSVIKKCASASPAASGGHLSKSDKIDRVVTNSWLAYPIFAAVMFIVYFVSVTTVGTIATDWANDGVFGDGWHLFGIGGAEYEEALEQFESEAEAEAEDHHGEHASGEESAGEDAENEDAVGEEVAGKDAEGEDAAGEEVASKDADGEDASGEEAASGDIAYEEPDPADYGIWIPGVPIIAANILDAVNCAEWLQGLIIDGIIAGVGAVLGFVPQMFILFIFLAFLEGCGYMARAAFIMDRFFRRLGLSGKSFIPFLIGTGCGVPAIMAARTIGSDRERRLTVMCTTFLPCSAKLPVIAMISGAIFADAWWVAPSAYFVGVAAVVLTALILKKTNVFAGKTEPFIMELPAYQLPTVRNVLASMWERAWSFIKKAGTIILLAAVFVWFTSNFGWGDEGFGMVDMDDSVLAKLGGLIAWMFAPLGWGTWQAAVASITGLIAKENIVGTIGILYGFAEVSEEGVEIWSNLAADFTPLAAYSFLLFNLLCIPCFAAVGALRREMESRKWFWFAVAYQCVFAYVVALCVYQLGLAFTGHFGIGSVAALLLVAGIGYLLFRPSPLKKQ